MNELDRQIMTIFTSALEHGSDEERAAYLDRACGQDTALRARVEALLQAHAEAGEFLGGQRSAADPVLTIDDPPAERPGVVIGPYKLLQQIGEGGMGTVYMAEQTQPMQRKVALKIIKPGMDSRQIVARFEAERQALALMDHPNIAKVLEAGTTDTGRPYFVMELVHGVAITKYCDEKRLTPRERLELFVPVCQAVQHAHQKGIIHRDLKPSNVMIALYDGKPVPKVIDFGVAKATGPKLTDKTLFTEFGSIVGTLEYMSPEQAERNQLDIDTRSDIYSLGVLLYELLTGTTPLDRKRLQEAGILEVLRIIREEEPPKPSTRLSTTDELPSIAANRGVEPKKLSGLMRGELDWIVMKCLDKDRNRRYATANGLAMDLQRYLGDESVQACPPSTAYRLRKFLRRNKRALVMLAVVCTLLLAVAVVSTVGYWRTSAALNREATARRQADTARATTEAVDSFLIHEMLLAADPEQAQGRAITVKEVLDQAAAKVGTAFPDQPEVEAAVRDTIGASYLSLGRYPDAEPHLARALEVRQRLFGDEHPDSLTSLSRWAQLLQNKGKPADAEPLFRKVLETRRRVLGPEHPDTVRSMDRLGQVLFDRSQFSEAETLFRAAREASERVLGAEHPDTAASMGNLATVLTELHKLDEAERLHVRSLEISRRTLGEEHSKTMRGQQTLALLYHMQGKLAEAEPLFRKILEVQGRILGEDHPQIQTIRNNLAALLHRRGKLTEAERLFRKALEIQRRKLGEEHEDTLVLLNNLADVLSDENKLAEAETLRRQVYETARRVLGEDHRGTLASRYNLARMLYWQGKYVEAEPLFRKTLNGARRVLGEEHPHTLSTMNNLAYVLQARGELGEAEPLLRKVLEVERKRLPANDPAVGSALAALGGLLINKGEPEQAEALLREALKIHRAAPPGRRAGLANSQSLLGSCLVALGRYEEAEPLLLESYAAMKDNQVLPAEMKLRVLRRIIQLYESWKKPDKATAWRAKLPPDPKPPGKPPGS